MDDELTNRELDALVAEKIFGRSKHHYHCPHFDEKGRMLSFCGCPSLPRYSVDIAAAWQVDKPDWFWTLYEMPSMLQVELARAPKERVTVRIRWLPEGKAATYALGRCRAALKAIEAAYDS